MFYVECTEIQTEMRLKVSQHKIQTHTHTLTHTRIHSFSFAAHVGFTHTHIKFNQSFLFFHQLLCFCNLPRPHFHWHLAPPPPCAPPLFIALKCCSLLLPLLCSLWSWLFAFICLTYSILAYSRNALGRSHSVKLCLAGGCGTEKEMPANAYLQRYRYTRHTVKEQASLLLSFLVINIKPN